VKTICGGKTNGEGMFKIRDRISQTIQKRVHCLIIKDSDDVVVPHLNFTCTTCSLETFHFVKLV
jgi:hypothetical protein